MSLLISVTAGFLGEGMVRSGLFQVSDKKHLSDEESGRDTSGQN